MTSVGQRSSVGAVFSELVFHCFLELLAVLNRSSKVC